jgi:hypothetical protein
MYDQFQPELHGTIEPLHKQDHAEKQEQAHVQDHITAQLDDSPKIDLTSGPPSPPRRNQVCLVSPLDVR